jgi:phosphoglycolate phosphatase-like HAD superfamily hydrolase
MLDVLDHPDFDVVVTGDEVKRSKPFPDLLEAALLRGDLDVEDVLVVGDSVWDIQAAQQINAPSIGLECGGTSAAELQDAGAELVFGDPAALLAALRSARPGVASWS